MAYRITDQWIMKPNGKTKHLQFRQADIIKTKSTQAEIPKFTKQDIEDINTTISELEELKMLRKLPLDEQFNRLEQTEEDEKDLDPHELLMKRRLERDEEPNEDDIFMKKLEGNYKKICRGDKLMQTLGAINA